MPVFYHRIRHVKCDEQKPSCFRCRSTGRKCDGYLSIGSGTVCSTPGPLALSVQSTNFPGNERDRRSFDFFRNRTTQHLSGYIETRFWDQTVLQASHFEPAVRHAAIALGSLHENIHLWKRPDHCASVTDVDGSFSLRHYINAIICLRKLLPAPDSRSIELTLVCSAICICFEVLRGNDLSAYAHLKNALKIISSGQGQRTRPRLGNEIFSQATAAPFDDGLVQVFVRLDFQASLFSGMRPPALKATTSIEATEVFPTYQ